jgi:hypothetical protein
MDISPSALYWLRGKNPLPTCGLKQCVDCLHEQSRAKQLAQSSKADFFPASAAASAFFRTSDQSCEAFIHMVLLVAVEVSNEVHSALIGAPD